MCNQAAKLLDHNEKLIKPLSSGEVYIVLANIGVLAVDIGISTEIEPQLDPKKLGLDLVIPPMGIYLSDEALSKEVILRDVFNL